MGSSDWDGGFWPIREASKRRRAAAGRKRRTGHQRRSCRKIKRVKSFFARRVDFFRFRRSRTLILPAVSSESSSEIMIEMLLLLSLNIEDDDSEVM